MAKSPPRRSPPARIAGTTDDASQCHLREVRDSPNFDAPTGATVKLFTHEHVGAVLIAKAEYGGIQLVPAGQAVSEITFSVLPDRNTLKMVFVFSASITGRGELRENCGRDSHFLRALAGDEPLQLLPIVGR
jgi:hypothetical protein